MNSYVVFQMTEFKILRGFQSIHIFGDRNIDQNHVSFKILSKFLIRQIQVKLGRLIKIEVKTSVSQTKSEVGILFLYILYIASCGINLNCIGFDRLFKLAKLQMNIARVF